MSRSRRNRKNRNRNKNKKNNKGSKKQEDAKVEAAPETIDEGPLGVKTSKVTREGGLGIQTSSPVLVPGFISKRDLSGARRLYI
jgi:hypothetical protein